VFKTLLKRLNNKIGCVKIHICNPHRDDIFYSEYLLPEVILNAVSALSSTRFIEIPHPKNGLVSGL
jgi:hypothetical protein